jgi:uncharacterized protein DUF4232
VCRTLFLAAAAVGLVTVTACTSSGSGSGAGSSPPTGASLAGPSTESTGPSSTAPSSAPTTPPTTPKSTPRPRPPGPPACTSSQLKIRAIRGSASAGQEFAELTFTNAGAKVCTIFGYPGVSLRLANKLIGKPAERSGQAHSTVTLLPGARAMAKIADISSCQAPVSDTVRVYAPNQVAFVDLPLALRACRLFIGPVTRG